MTFSVMQFEPKTGSIGVAVASKYLAVGSIVPYARAGVGLIATQFFANPQFGPAGLELLEQGASCEDVIEALLEGDPHRMRRQLVVMDANGQISCFTGAACLPCAGELVGAGRACSGNTLLNDDVLLSAYNRLEDQDGSLWDRLIDALDAGQRAGGDKSGQQSASLLVVRPNGGYGGYSDRLIDLRVDDHALPIDELRRVLGVWAKEKETIAR